MSNIHMTKCLLCHGIGNDNHARQTGKFPFPVDRNLHIRNHSKPSEWAKEMQRTRIERAK